MPMEIDKRWFQHRFQDRDLTQRDVAATLQLDPSAVSLMLKGDRKMQIDEAARLAELLGVPVDEVMSRAGIEPPKGRKGTVMIAGWIGADGEVHPGKIDAPRRGPLPPELPEDAVALRVQVATGEAIALNGWLMYYVPGDRVDPEAIGRLSVVQLAGNGPRYLRLVTRGYSPGKWTLCSFVRPEDPRYRIEDVRLEWACPVLWIRT